jgi:hypothetical protein
VATNATQSQARILSLFFVGGGYHIDTSRVIHSGAKSAQRVARLGRIDGRDAT